MHSLTLELLLSNTNLMQRFSYSLILRPHQLTGPDLRTQHWAGIECSLFVSKEASRTAFSQGHQRFLLSLYQSNQLLRCHSMRVFFFHTTETIPCLTFSHSLPHFSHISLSFVVTLIQYPPITVSPPPLPVVEVVSVMAVGRLPAAGEILINSLFICVERRAPAFWALVLWWR